MEQDFGLSTVMWSMYRSMMVMMIYRSRRWTIIRMSVMMMMMSHGMDERTRNDSSRHYLCSRIYGTFKFGVPIIHHNYLLWLFYGPIDVPDVQFGRLYNLDEFTGFTVQNISV